MSPISITFATATNPGFQWLDKFEKVEKNEIEEIIFLLRGALAAFFAELADRYNGYDDLGHEDPYLMIRNCAERINHEGFSQVYEDRFKNLHKSLADPNDASKERVDLQAARQYLWLVSRTLGWPYALLIFCALGKWRLQNYSDEQRTKILKYVAQNGRSLRCPRLEKRAIHYKLHQINIKLDFPFTRGCKKRSYIYDDSEDPATRQQIAGWINENHDANSGHRSFKNRKLPVVVASAQNISTSDEDSQTPLTAGSATSSQPSSLSSAPAQSSSDGWENFKDLLSGGDIQHIGYLLRLLHAFGGSRIPDLIFKRTQASQLRWDDSGVMCEITALEAGLDQQLLDILHDTERLDETIQPYVESNFKNGFYTLKSCLQSKISQALSDQEREIWSIKALKCICFVFPRDQLWETQPSYAAAVKLLLPTLFYTLEEAERRGVAIPFKNEASEALLAASKVGSLQSRQHTLTLAKSFLDDKSSLCLQAELAYQQSNVSRLVADFGQSERLIHDFCCRCGVHSDNCISRFYRCYQPERVSKRMNALYGRLHGSHLENLVQCEKYASAIEEVDDWTTSKSPSLMECRVLPSRSLTVAKIFRSQGLFTEARSGLESCLTTLLPHDSNRCQVLCSLADVYCDLRLTDKASDLIRPEIERERQKVGKSKSLRRLLVALIDACIQKNLYNDALRIIQELQNTFGTLSDLDVSDQLLHVRVLVASARICHYNSQFQDALQRWEATLIHVQAYKSFEGEGFTYALIHLSMSLAHLESSNDEDARSAFERAEKILARGTRDFWIPTLMLWGQDLVSRIQLLSGWDVGKLCFQSSIS